MNKQEYKEKQSQIAKLKAESEIIEAELKDVPPPELWISFYEDSKYTPVAHTTQAEAESYQRSIVERITKYVIAE